MLTVVDLGQKVKAKYPGMYDDLPDDAVGQKVKAKYPTQYADFSDTPSVQAGPQDTWLDRYLSVGPAMFKSVDQFGNAIQGLGDSSQSWPQRLGNVISNIPLVGGPLTESAHALNRLTGIEPQVPGGSTGRDLLRAIPGGSLVQDPFEEMTSGQAPEGLRDLTMLGAGMYGRPVVARYGEPIQPVAEGARNIWNPTSKKNVGNVYNPKAGEFLPPPVPEPGGTLTHAVRAATPDVVQGAAKLGGGLVVSHFLPHWAQAMMGYPEFSGAKQIGEGLSKGYQAYTPPPIKGTRMMNVTPFDLGAPEPPSVASEWQPPQAAPSSVGIPATATPRGAIVGGPQNVPAPAPLPARYVAPVQTGPSSAPDLSPVQPIPATTTPSGRSIPSVGERIARASSPSVSPEESLANIQEFTGKLKRGAKNQTFVQPNAGVTASSPFAPVNAPAPSQAQLFQPPIAPEIQQAVLPTPVEAPVLRGRATAAPPPATPAVSSDITAAVTGAQPLTPPAAPAAPSGLLQNLIKTVQSSPDKNAETIAEHAGNIGHDLTTNKNATIAQHLLGQGINADAWDALPMEEKNAWVKKVNAAQKKSYKPFGADFGPGRYGRPAEEGARQVGDALRVLGAQLPGQ